MQRSCLVPLVVPAAQSLLLFMGANALSAALNALGLLFLLELDDMAFKILPEMTKMRIEGVGTIQVGQYEQRIFNAAKLTCIPVVTVFCLQVIHSNGLNGHFWSNSKWQVLISSWMVLIVLPRVLADTVEHGSRKKCLKWAIVRLMGMLFKMIASFGAAYYITWVTVVAGGFTKKFW